MLAITLLIYGFLAAAAALLIEVVTGSFANIFPTALLTEIPHLTPALIFVFWAAFIEEGSKWIFFRQYQLRFGEQYEFPSGLRLGILFGLGFALLELGLIGFQLKPLALLPLLGIVGLHLLTSLFYAYYLFRPAPRTLFHSLTLIAGMTLLHSAYNFLVLF